ncbi:GSCOCG00002905001-RA-CDS [Cotesia congregata]|nr:GSCOCG00002905001-RA-CDS [Cotesia congregata]
MVDHRHRPLSLPCCKKKKTIERHIHSSLRPP